MKFNKKREAYPPLDNTNCIVLRTGNIVEVKTMSANPVGLLTIQRVDKDHYIDLNTGEVKEYKHIENRSGSPESLYRTYKKIRDYINNNFTGAKNELFITLTYAENMTDVKRLYRDYEVFWKRLKRRYPNLEYFCVVEPQARGAWHCHVLIKDPSTDNLYIPNSEIDSLWRNGFTKTCRLDCDNIGAYLTAYLADIALEEYVTLQDVPDTITIKEVTIQDDNGKPVSKRMVKGGRCYLYPSGMNIFRCSRGIHPPIKERMKFSQVKEIVGTAYPDYTRTVEITTDDGELLNTVSTYTYNLIRSKKQGGKTKNDNSNGFDGIFGSPAD